MATRRAPATHGQEHPEPVLQPKTITLDDLFVEKYPREILTAIEDSFGKEDRTTIYIDAVDGKFHAMIRVVIPIKKTIAALTAFSGVVWAILQRI